MRTRSILPATIGTAVALLLGACTLDDSGPGAEAGSLAEEGDLEDVAVNVASKGFTEQLVLCEITALALESADATVERTCGMSGSNTVREALVSGDVDMHWEYTGTGWIEHLQRDESITDPREQYEAVADADLKENGIRWLEPAPADNSYAIAVAESKATDLGVETISDYAELAEDKPGQASFCGAAEFFGRDDGWPGVQESYGFSLPGSATAELTEGAIYDAISKSDPCAFGEVFSTDGRIEGLDLTVLEDDKDFFSPYNPSLTVREQVIDENPQVAEIIAPISESLDDDTLRELNAQVDVEGQTPEKVAEEWLQHEGFIG